MVCVRGVCVCVSTVLRILGAAQRASPLSGLQFGNGPPLPRAGTGFKCAAPRPYGRPDHSEVGSGSPIKGASATAMRNGPPTLRVDGADQIELGRDAEARNVSAYTSWIW
jgi:hypothetical protein